MSEKIDLTGVIFGRLTAISSQTASSGKTHWECKCSCGGVCRPAYQNLVDGKTRSCGCLRAEMTLARRLTGIERKTRRAERAKIVAKTPKRKSQKQQAQLKYQISDKAALAQFRRWSKKQKKNIEISEDEVLNLRTKNCHKCGNDIPRTGVPFMLVNPRGPISLGNITPTCGVCKLIKPKENFDPIEHSKKLIRRFWKRTPMAAIAKHTAQKAVGRYECASCKGLFSDKLMDLDHISPVVDPIVGYIDLETWVKRLLCDEKNLQFLCKPCHSRKTTSENSQRVKNRSKK